MSYYVLYCLPQPLSPKIYSDCARRRRRPTSVRGRAEFGSPGDEVGNAMAMACDRCMVQDPDARSMEVEDHDR